MVRPFWKVMRRYPQIPSELLDKAEASDARVPVALAQEMLRGAIVLTSEPNLGLLAAQEMEHGSLEVLEYAAFSAPSWRELFATVFRYSHLMNEAADFRLDVIGDKAHLVLHSTVPLTRAGTDFQTAAFHVAAMHWLKPTPPEAEVWFMHERPEDLSHYRKVFGDNPIVFGAPWDGLVLDATRLDEPLPTSDAALHGVLRQHGDRLLADLAPGDSLLERVRAKMLESLADGPATAADVAEEMGITRRTLTRRLAQHGTSFTALLEEVRKHSASHYLKTSDHSIEDIAFLLGFSESSPFVRAFKRWTGMAPTQFRRAYRGR
jgi:AraC-like DNA-binding protein